MLWDFWQWLLSLLPESWTEPIDPMPEMAEGAISATAEWPIPFTGTGNDTSGDEPTEPKPDSNTVDLPEPPTDETMDTSMGTAGQEYNGSGKVKKQTHEIIVDLKPKRQGQEMDEDRGGR